MIDKMKASIRLRAAAELIDDAINPNGPSYTNAKEYARKECLSGAAMLIMGCRLVAIDAASMDRDLAMTFAKVILAPHTLLQAAYNGENPVITCDGMADNCRVIACYAERRES